EVGKKDAAVPSFVSIGGRAYGAGFLGAKFQPPQVQDASRGVEDLKSVVTAKQLGNRLGLLAEMEKAFHGEYKTPLARDHKTTYDRAVKLMHSKESKAFDLSLEPGASRSKYGSGRFAEGVLMA